MVWFDVNGRMIECEGELIAVHSVNHMIHETTKPGDRCSSFAPTGESIINTQDGRVFFQGADGSSRFLTCGWLSYECAGVPNG